MQLIEWDSKGIKELVDLWNQEMGDSFPMHEKLFEQNSFSDINVYNEGSRIAVNGEGEVIGFIVAKRWQDDLDIGISRKTGWIQAVVVDRNYRNQGIGTALLNHAESKLKTVGVNLVWLGRDTWHYFPGVPAQYENAAKWFEKRGYSNKGKEFDLINFYEQPHEPSKPSKTEIVLSVLKKKEEKQFIAFMHRCFPGRWEYEAIQYFQKGGTGREFVVMKKNNHMIGFCRINDANSPFIAQNVYWSSLFTDELGGIGPLGIDSNERKNGYGLAIVEAAVSYLRDRSITTIVIDWTGLIDFYNKLGYDVWKSYYSFRKSM